MSVLPIAFTLVLLAPPGAAERPGPPVPEARFTAHGERFHLGIAKPGQARLVVAWEVEIHLFLGEGEAVSGPKVLYPLPKGPPPKIDERLAVFRMLRVLDGPDGDLHVYFQMGEGRTDDPDPSSLDSGRTSPVFYARFSAEGKPRLAWSPVPFSGSARDVHRLLGAFPKGKDIALYAAVGTPLTLGSRTSFTTDRIVLGYQQGAKYKPARSFAGASTWPREAEMVGTSEKDAIALFPEKGQLCWTAIDRYAPRIASPEFGEYLDGFGSFAAREGAAFIAVLPPPERRTLKKRAEEMKPEEILEEVLASLHRKLWVGSGRLGGRLEPVHDVGILPADFRSPIRWSFAREPDGPVHLFAGGAVRPEDIAKVKKVDLKKEDLKVADIIPKARLAWWSLAGDSFPATKYLPAIEVESLQDLQAVFVGPKKAVVAWSEAGTIRVRTSALDG